MEIKTLKDLKEALANIPEEVLDKFGAGNSWQTSDDVELLIWDEDESKEEEMTEKFEGYLELYPTLDNINDWIICIGREYGLIEIEDEIALNRGEPISSYEIVDDEECDCEDNEDEDESFTD